MSATATKTKPFRLFTPLRTYLFCSAFLVFLATSPFTVGKGIARLCDFFANTWSGLTDAVTWSYASLVLWNAHATLVASFLAAGAGFVFVSLLLLLMRYKWRGWYRWTPLMLVGLVNELLVSPMPAPSALYDAFAAAGGTPAWLNFIATAILTIFTWFSSVWFGAVGVVGLFMLVGIVVERLEHAQ